MEESRSTPLSSATPSSPSLPTMPRLWPTPPTSPLTVGGDDAPASRPRGTLFDPLLLAAISDDYDDELDDPENLAARNRFFESRRLLLSRTRRPLRLLLSRPLTPHCVRLEAEEFEGFVVVGAPKETAALNCPICLCAVDGDETTHCRLPCGHGGHEACMRKWFTKECQHPTCPCCRADARAPRTVLSASRVASAATVSAVEAAVLAAKAVAAARGPKGRARLAARASAAATRTARGTAEAAARAVAAERERQRVIAAVRAADAAEDAACVAKRAAGSAAGSLGLMVLALNAALKVPSREETRHPAIAAGCDAASEALAERTETERRSPSDLERLILEHEPDDEPDDEPVTPYWRRHDNWRAWPEQERSEWREWDRARGRDMNRTTTTTSLPAMRELFRDLGRAMPIEPADEPAERTADTDPLRPRRTTDIVMEWIERSLDTTPDIGTVVERIYRSLESLDTMPAPASPRPAPASPRPAEDDAQYDAECVD